MKSLVGIGGEPDPRTWNRVHATADASSTALPRVSSRAIGDKIRKRKAKNRDDEIRKHHGKGIVEEEL